MSIVPGRDVPKVPQEWVDAVNKAVNDANHDELCSCNAWPENCRYYKPGQWDIGVDLDIAVGVLAPLVREAVAREIEENPMWDDTDGRYAAARWFASIARGA